MPKLVRNSLFLILIGLPLAACGSAGTIERADIFATAGIAYTDAVPTVINQSFEIAVTANSLQLEMNRESLSVESRLDELERFDRQFEQRLSILRDLKRHAGILRTYFAALRSLAQSDAATGITDVTTGLVEKLEKLRPEIAGVQIGGFEVSEFIAPAVSFAVGAYKNAAIRRELEAHGEIIERELALQEAALRALTEQMITDKDLEIQITERNPIIEDFAGSGSLPANWTERRIAAYRRTIEIDSLKAAQKAAANLHQAWVALSENRLDEGGILLLLQDVEELVDLARSLKAS
jgi:hypothetical protein